MRGGDPGRRLRGRTSRRVVPSLTPGYLARAISQTGGAPAALLARAFERVPEIRFVAGTFGGGPATAWFRLTRPLVGGETPSALQRLAAASDFGAGLSGMLPRGDYLAESVLHDERGRVDRATQALLVAPREI